MNFLDWEETRRMDTEGQEVVAQYSYACPIPSLLPRGKGADLPLDTDIFDATTADSADLFLQFPAGESTTGAGISTGRFA